METLDILIFNWKDLDHPEAGGAERTTYEVAKRWVRWGHRVHLFCGNYPNGRRRENVDGIEITRLGGKYSVYSSAVSHYFSECKGKFDVVIDEINTVPFFTPLYVKEPKAAFIHQLAREVLYTVLPLIQAKFWSFMEPRVLKLYKDTLMITVSESTRKDLIEIGIPERNVHVVGNGVDHNLYKPSKVESSRPYVLYVGRIRRNKGIHYLIRSMKQVVEDFPDAKLFIAGRGDFDYIESLVQLTNRLRLQNSVYFRGYVDEKEKIRLMQEACVVAIPSQREGFGLVVIESNACGTPVIATDVPGLRDTVIDRETGFLVPYGDVKSLSVAILRVLRDWEVRDEMSQKAIRWADNFNWNASAGKFLEILKESASVRS